MLTYLCPLYTKLTDCQTITHKNPNTLQLVSGCDITFFDTVAALRRATFPTSDLAPDFFLHFDYLETLEKCVPKGIKMAYLLLQKQGTILGFTTLQIKRFNAAESLQWKKENKKISDSIKYFLANLIDFNVVTLGNLLLTGEHGFWFDEKQLNEADFFATIKQTMPFVEKQLKKRGNKVSALFWKDFYTQKPILTRATEGGERWNEFQVEENFVFSVSENWQTMDDYLAALHSKARMRAKRALKKTDLIERKSFNAAQIKAYQQEIQDLYLQISRNASFNLFELPTNYFWELKENLPQNFSLFGYFLEGKLVAFYSTFQNGDTLDAHFLGYDHTLNAEYQLYLNSLYDILNNALTLNRDGAQIRRIVFGRTAAEIKSSVGAEAKPMYLYWRHRFEVVNRIFPALFRWLSPQKQEWTPRHPFK